MRDLVISAAKNHPDTDFFICRDSRFPSVTGERLCSICKRAQSVLPKGRDAEHIALLGPNSAAWITAYFAVISSGNVVVPLHYGLKHDELKEYISRSDCSMLLFDERCSEEAEMLAEEIAGLTIRQVHDFLDQAEMAPEEEWPELPADAPVAMYFTSGTTARSRCVILTHRNLASQVNAIFSVLPLSRDDTGLSVLPLSHTFEMMTYVVGALYCGGTLYINDSLRNMKANLKRCKPTILVAVPLILQTLRKEILRNAEKQGRSEALERGMRLNGRLQKIGINAGPRIFSEIHESFGGRLRTVICGGAALDPELIEFYRRLGVQVLQGYGITECSPVVSTNSPGADRPGSVGRPLPCCEVRLIDGEICVRGDSVSPGYYGDEEANAASYQDGWFHTGDLGYMDRDGFLYCTGRIKNLIILANGENVSPEELEEHLYRIEGIRDAVVYERDGKITAEIYADRDRIPDKSAAWELIGPVNRSLAAYKQIGDIVLRDKEFEKTATRKIKRYHQGEGQENETKGAGDPGRECGERA